MCKPDKENIHFTQSVCSDNIWFCGVNKFYLLCGSKMSNFVVSQSIKTKIRMAYHTCLCHCIQDMNRFGSSTVDN